MIKMKIWLLKPRELKPADDPWYDCWDKSHGFVIQAESARGAREIAAENAGDEKGVFDKVNPWLYKKYVTCEELKPRGKKANVILQDFS